MAIIFNAVMDWLDNKPVRRGKGGVEREGDTGEPRQSLINLPDTRSIICTKRGFVEVVKQGDIVERKNVVK